MVSSTVSKKLKRLLKEKEFIHIATSDLSGHPNGAPKFLLKIKSHSIYVADYILGRTWTNLQLNPEVSVSAMDYSTLVGYRINGKAKIIKGKKIQKNLFKEMSKKEITFSTKRIIEGVKKEKKYKNFELSFPENLGFFRIDVEEIAKINPTGYIKKDKRIKKGR